MAAGVTFRGESVDVSRPTAVAGGRIPVVGNVYQSPYDVGPDGRLLAVFLDEDEIEIPPVTLLLNWQGK
jgi:hypothetical protein